MKKIFSRPESLKDTPFHYCPGCGHSIIHRLVAEVIDELGIRERTIGVPPAGCAVLAYNYFDVDMAEAPHGRAAAVATGIKRMLPDRIVFTYQGDGDIAAIGTAETIHAASQRRASHLHLRQQCDLWHDWRSDGPHYSAGTGYHDNARRAGTVERRKPDRSQRNAGSGRGKCLYREKPP